MAASIVTHARLLEVLHYDPDTGVFVWRIGRKHVIAGTTAGSLDNYGYLIIMVDRQRYRAHRLAWFYSYGVWPADQIDHINRDRVDNRLVNLREANNTENAQNTLKKKNNTSGHKGVRLDKRFGLWYAHIRVGGNKHYLGTFPTAAEAGECYRVAARIFHPLAPECD
jgi:outer membrane protein assembly factor BamB